MQIKHKLLIFLIAFILITFTLFSGTDISLLDNGDYIRVMRLSSLEFEDVTIKITRDLDNPFSAIPEILFDTTGIDTYPSSQLIFVRLSVVASLFVNMLSGCDIDVYHIGALGVIYSLMYAWAITHVFGRIKFKSKRHFVALALSLIILCDIGYVAYFNSLYGEGLQHILLVAFVGYMISAAQGDIKKRDIILCAVTLALYGTSKSFNIPCAFLFMLMYMIVVLFNKKHRIICIASTVLSVAVLITSFVVIPDWIGSQTNYNSVFFGMLRGTNADEAKEYLSDIGLPENMYELRNTNHYVSNFAEIEEKYDLSEVYDLKYFDLVAFYAKRPFFTISKVPYLMKFCGSVRNDFFMDTAYMRDIRLSLWSIVRENTGFDTMLNIVIIVAFLVLLRKRKTIMIFTTIAILYSLFMPYAANGDADLAKHMFMFVEFIDLMLIYIIFAGANSKKSAAIIWSATAVTLICGYLVANMKKEPEVYVFGGREWYIAEDKASYLTLMSKESVSVRMFDRHSNKFSESDIREWLNGEFIDTFSEADRKRLAYMNHKVILSEPDRASATSGTRDFYCIAYPTLSAIGYDEAYSVTLTDYATLPSIKLISNLANEGYSTDLNGNYWLETCYFSGGGKVRYVNESGNIYFASADEFKNIHPVIRVKK